jgi:CBS domain containing-hemolysin-like protein
MLDRIPQPGETVGTEDGMVFEILEGAKNRIDRVKLVLPAEEIKDLQAEGTGDTIRN